MTQTNLACQEVLHPQTRKCVFVGDLHAGSRVGLWVQHELEDGTIVGQNPAQAYLEACWHDFWRKMREAEYDTVFLLGDLCDSNNRKEWGRNLSSTELLGQVDVAEKLLAPYVRDRKVISVEGSRYHQSLDTSLDRRVCERLSSYCDIEHAGLMAVGELEGTGRVVNAEHARIGGTMYKLTPLDRDSWVLDSAYHELGYYTDILASAHAHWSAIIDLSTGNRDRWIIQAPGWKLWFPYKPGGYGKKIPHIGGCYATVSSKKIEASKHLYPYHKAHDKMRCW